MSQSLSTQLDPRPLVYDSDTLAAIWVNLLVSERWRCGLII